MKDLLVHLDDGEGCKKRLDAAVRLAQQHEAHLTGLYVMSEVPLLEHIQAYIPPDVQASMQAELQAKADAAHTAFRQAAERAGISYEARLDRALDPAIAKLVSMHARYADIVVLGQVDPEHPPLVGRHLPEEVLLSSGRPVLMVPYIGALSTLGQRVVVAWDASREAARAVSDAMPILQRAESVLVVSFNPEGTPFGHGAVPGADIARHLARHQLQVEAQSIDLDRMDTGEALLSLVADRASDLVVMGAYAHARVRELILGGVTRKVLESMTVPVLMAH